MKRRCIIYLSTRKCTRYATVYKWGAELLFDWFTTFIQKRKEDTRIGVNFWFFSLLFTWFYSFQFDITMWVNDFRIYVYLACNTSSTDDFMQRPTDSQILMNAIEFLFHISQILNVYRIWNWIAYAYFWVGRLFLLQFIYWFHLFLFENCLNSTAKALCLRTFWKKCGLKLFMLKKVRLLLEWTREFRHKTYEHMNLRIEWKATKSKTKQSKRKYT